MTKRNNFPREGQHSVVTLDAVSRLLDEQPDQGVAVDFATEDGAGTRVHTTAESARDYAINRGFRILRQASISFENNLARAAHTPLAPEFEPATHKPLTTDFKIANDNISALKQRALQRRDAQAQEQSQDRGQDI